MAKCSFHETRGWGKSYCLKKNDYVDNKIYYDYCNSYRYDDCPIYKQGSSSGGCYLTTACVEYKGLPDDCVQLETLRKFRDEYMMHTDDGAKEIQEYYIKAPIVIEKIRERGKAEEEFNRLYDEVIVPCVEFINKGENEKAHDRYRAMVKDLENKYLS